MTPRNLLRLTATAAAVTGLGVATTVGTAAPGDAGTSPKITKAGVGKVKLGTSYRQLRRQGLVRRIQPGCELGGPDTRSARLKPPLEGTVNFTQNRPRRVRDITISDGAEARGVGVGDRIRDIKAAYPKAKVNRKTEETFGIWLVRVPKSGGGPLRFAVDADTRRITLIGVPYVAFCE
jgi:hypothetical protein